MANIYSDNYSAVIYRIAKINGEYKTKFVCPSSNPRRAVSILKSHYERAKEEGLDVRKVGKYYFFRQGEIIGMTYSFNRYKEPSLKSIIKAYEEGVKVYNS